MAHVKAGGVAKGNKDSVSKRLGVKIYGGQMARAGNILIRQKGSKVWAGVGASMGSDSTIFALKDGTVKFLVREGKQFVSVV
ncbi:50S ribosomal protein L27 [Candidatus Gottesmanbacteria bacterium]|nr:50S ribosomal protein L27 [Candidatus Gottesmanbacteria bacterium]